MSSAVAMVLAAVCTLGVCAAVGVAWWLSWRRRWAAVFDQSVKKAFPEPIVRLAHLHLWSTEEWGRERVQQELTKRTGLTFPEW